MSKKIALNARELLADAERRMQLGEAELIEEILERRRRKEKEPDIPAEESKRFRKLLIQEAKDGTLDRARVEELLQKLLDGEL